jgi:predicted PurR-regulated permease PerM
MILPFFQVLVWAGVLAMIFYPVYARLIRWGRSPITSGIATTLLVVVTVVVPLTFLGLSLIGEVTEAVPQLQDGIARVAAALHPESPLRVWLQRYVDLNKWLEPEAIGTRLRALSGVIAAELVSVVGDIFGAGVQAFFVLFTLYYLLKDADRIIAAIRQFIPLDAPDAERIMNETNGTIRASLHGVLSIAAIQGALGGVAFWVLGLSSPLLWGVAMFFMSMIPIAGAFVVWGPAALFLLFTGHWLKALLLALWGGVVIGTADNILRPRFVGQKTRLHELVVLFAVLGGLRVFGMLGVVVGPVVVAITLALIDVWRQANAARPAAR